MNLLLLIPLLLSGQADPPRLRTLLPNGATVLVERMPKEQRLSVQLWASARGVEETPETHGLRHMLEHLIVRGEGDLGPRLEAQGAFIRARTYRDAMQVEVTAGPEQLDLALSALQEILKPLEVSEQRIATEARVMAQERAMLEPETLLGSAAWLAAYGDAGLDPQGDPDVLVNAKPELLRGLQAKHFAAPNLVIVVAGPVGLDGATRSARAILEGLAKADQVPGRERPEGMAGRQETSGFGEARAAVVPGYQEVRAAGALAAALGIGSELGGCFVSYTPSPYSGVVVLGRSEFASGLGLYIDGLEDAVAVSLYARGKAMAREWVNAQLRTPEGAASLRGMLLCHSPSHRPERLLEAIESLTEAQFMSGVAAFRKGNAAVAVGVR